MQICALAAALAPSRILPGNNPPRYSPVKPNSGGEGCWPNDKRALFILSGVKFVEVRPWSNCDTMEWNFLSGVGAVFLGYYSLNLVLQILHGMRAFLLPALGMRKNLKKLGEWAGKRWRAGFIVQSSVWLYFSLSLQTFPRLFQVSLLIMHCIVSW